MIDLPTSACWLTVVAATIAFTAGPAPCPAQGPTVLDPNAWRADLHQLEHAIRTTHPRPFAHVDRKAFKEAVAALDAEIPELSDHAIMLRMSRLAGRLTDGHTRLSLPRTHPTLAFSYSHSADPAPTNPRLRFSQLPVSFIALDEGLFVHEAAAGFGEYVGRQVLALGGLPADRALEEAGAAVSADNDGGRRLNGADLLESPEAVEALGGRLRDCGLPVRLARRDADSGVSEVCWRPLADDAAISTPGGERPYSVRTDTARGLVVLELDEITTLRDRPLSGAVADAIHRAETAGARLVVDLRKNTGGSNSYGLAVPLALARSPELNTYGRTFVLVGPRTFSAAQSLLNELERYTRALFVGEPSGSHPDHYGDSRKIRLEHSGLTLRVSTLHWSSGTSGDQRDATRPHIPAPRTAATVFGPGDAALDSAASFRFDGLGALIRSQLLTGAVYNAANLAYYSVVSGGPPRLLADDYLAMADDFTDADLHLQAAYALQVGLLAHPGAPRLEAAMEDAMARIR